MIQRELRDYLDLLRKEAPEEIRFVNKAVDPKFELSAVIAKLESLNRYPALVFNRVHGFSFPVVSNLFSSRRRLAMALGQIVRQYEQEIGVPWKTADRWLRISFPFFQADRIKTPTLYMGGEKDFNVPIIGSEQMYQALKSLGVDTQLVIYPGQFHGLTTPSYMRDRNERYLAWYGKYLKAVQ